MKERCACVSDSVLTSSPEPRRSGMEMLRSAEEPHAVRVSPVSIPATFAIIEPVTRTPLRNLRETLSEALSLWLTEWSEMLSRSDLSYSMFTDDLSCPANMFLNASSSRSMASAARYRFSLRDLYSRLLKAAIRTASTSPISSAFVPPRQTDTDGSSPPGRSLSPARQ